VQNLSVRSYRELTTALSVIDLHVPERGDKEDKRKTEQVERWSICRFLASYGNTWFVRYPLIVEKRDRPDYRLNSRSLLVGVEITEAVSEDMAHIDAMRHPGDEIIPLDVSLFRPGTPQRTTQELRGILEASRVKNADDAQVEPADEFDPVGTRAMGPGWAGDGVERDWAEAMFSVITAKSASAQKPGYTYFDETWLLVYDNWSLPMLDVPRAMQHLLPKLAPLWPTTVFKHVFIEHRQSFVRVSAPDFYSSLLPTISSPLLEDERRNLRFGMADALPAGDPPCTQNQQSGPHEHRNKFHGGRSVRFLSRRLLINGNALNIYR